MILGVVESNGEKMLLVWLQQGYRKTSAVYKEVLETKVLPWVKKITKESDYVLQQGGASVHTGKTVFLFQRLLTPTVTRFERPRLQLVDAQ